MVRTNVTRRSCLLQFFLLMLLSLYVLVASVALDNLSIYSAMTVPSNQHLLLQSLTVVNCVLSETILEAIPALSFHFDRASTSRQLSDQLSACGDC